MLSIRAASKKRGGKGELVSGSSHSLSSKEFTVSMSESSRSKCRVSPRKVKLETTDQGLTSYAGLLPVIRFMQKRLRFRELCSETVAHERGRTRRCSRSTVSAPDRPRAGSQTPLHPPRRRPAGPGNEDCRIWGE